MKQIFFLSILLVGACVSERSVHPLRPLEIVTSPYHGISTEGLTGSLMYEGDCLLFREEGNHLQLMPVWPDGSTFNGTSVTFHEPGKAEQRIIVGEEFRMEGLPLHWVDVPNPRAGIFAQQCAREPFAVLGVHPAN
jgi:hypothetical protein